jgi:hypothetical protein
MAALATPIDETGFGEVSQELEKLSWHLLVSQ